MTIPDGTIYDGQAVERLTIIPTKWGLQWVAHFGKRANIRPCAEGWPTRQAALAAFWEAVAGEHHPVLKPEAGR
jgi:hypothetical protein